MATGGYPIQGLALSLGLCLLLAACGGSRSERQTPTPNPNPPHLADERVAPLVQPGAVGDFERYLKNGILARAQGHGERAQDDFAVGVPAPVLDSVSEEGGASASGNFSDTNVHVEGVDEADRVKYDGRHLFVANSPRFHYYPTDSGFALREGSAHGIRILATQPETASASEVAHISYSHREHSLTTLYLVSDAEGAARDVTGISHKYDYGIGLGVWRWSPWWYGGNDSVVIDSFEVTDPSNPQQAWRMELDGALADSRKIGNVLYLVTRYSPILTDLIPYPSNAAERDANQALVAGTPVQALLPHYRITQGEQSGERQPLVDSSNCYLPETRTDNEGYADLVTISAIDLYSRELIGSVCLNTLISGIHVSNESLYLGASVGPHNERQTGVHKFALNNGQISYRGTGQVPGEMGWRATSFRMNEHGGDLRIVTTQWGGLLTGGDVAVTDTWVPPQQQFDHYLNILREEPDSNRLQIVASLPNEQRPEKIGKPGEDIFAVRFLGERAYVVTFEQIDPLYVLDLSDASDPRIAGELEIPGYSTYLHPIGADYLLGIGEEVTDQNGWVQPAGVKVELYDVRDPDNIPPPLGTFVIGSSGTSSPALYDLRAVNFLRTSDDQLRFTLPIDVVENWYWQGTTLHLYEINGLSGDGVASLESAGQITAKDSDSNLGHFWYGSNGYDARSRLHDDTVYYIYGSEVWSAFWDSPEEVNGPQ